MSIIKKILSFVIKIVWFLIKVAICIVLGLAALVAFGTVAILFFVLTFPWGIFILIWLWLTKDEREYHTNKRYIAKHMADEIRKNK